MTEAENLDELIQIEQEKLRIARKRLALETAQYELHLRAMRRANRSFMDKIDDFIFG